MRNQEVIDRFVQGMTTGRSSNGNLYIEGDKLVNYWTVLAVRKDGQFILNNDKYSQTTSTIQNKIRKSVPSYRLVELSEEGVKAVL